MNNKTDNMTPPAPPSFTGHDDLGANESTAFDSLNTGVIANPSDSVIPDLTVSQMPNTNSQDINAINVMSDQLSTTSPTEELVDSFGEKINQQETNSEANPALEPQFTHGMLMHQPPLPVAEETNKKNKMSLKNNKSDGLPPLVLLIIHLIALIVIGVGVFFLWKYQHDQIQTLKKSIKANNNQITDLNEQLRNTQDQIKISADLPVFVDQNGVYSFWQNIPGLHVKVNERQTEVHYGETSDSIPSDGFVLKILAHDINNLSLSQIVDQEYNLAETGISKEDLRSEMVADNMGFSYVRTEGQQEHIVYFLQKEADASNYVKISYQISADSEVNYHSYEKVIVNLLMSLKIY